MKSPVARKDRPHLRFPGVPAPKPLLAADTELRMTSRQRELLDDLEKLVAKEGIGDLTMAEIAAQTNCSLRTLYGLAPSKDELVLMVVDRRLHRIGRAAVESLDPAMSPVDLLRAYLQAANEAVQPSTVAYSLELASIRGAKRLLDAHEGYVMSVTQSLLERAVEEGQIPSVDTGSVAHVLGGLGREFARPEVAEVLRSTPKATADAITEIILRGLR
ncbi:MAG: TetR/AcrR family transcriptional regulator [Deltaproteobacteria bacterium]|nr:TetR/AcrR family transcriptional regulator [Deltaproteobacteria bacterium]